MPYSGGTEFYFGNLASALLLYLVTVNGLKSHVPKGLSPQDAVRPCPLHVAARLAQPSGTRSFKSRPASASSEQTLLHRPPNTCAHREVQHLNPSETTDGVPTQQVREQPQTSPGSGPRPAWTQLAEIQL